MIITQLDAHCVRIVSSIRLQLNARYNVLCGLNGSGKTSLLEAIYLLCAGHSFRTHQTTSLITQDALDLTVFARLNSDDEVSVQVSRQGTRARINQRSCMHRSELAALLPCQVFYHEMFSIIDAGPTVRRGVMDWGLFHVKQEYHALWKDCRRVLKQRNALLKQKHTDYALLAAWDKQWVELSEALHAQRLAYCMEWFAVFEAVLSELTGFKCVLTYEKGWDKKNTGKTLADTLLEQFDMDKRYQYTHAGAHQADIVVNAFATKAKQVLSRGQQKMVLIAMKIAQAQLINKPCVYLFDDVISELDKDHIDRLFALLTATPGQFFFTAIDAASFAFAFDASNSSFFSLAEGRLLSAVFE